MAEWSVNASEVFAERAAKLKALRADVSLLSAFFVHYKTNPKDFINDWGCTIDPRLDTPLVPFILFPKQEEFIDWLYDSFLNRKDGEVLKARDAGATWLAGAFSAWAIIFYPNTSIGFGSRKQDLVDKRGDMDSIFEKIDSFIQYLPAEFKPKSYERHLMKIINNDNGAAITGEAGDNIGRGGRNRMYFVDEAAFIERPETMDAALSMNTDIRIEISTPNGTGNPFYRKVHSGEYRVFQFNWRDDPRKDDEWYREQVRKRDKVIVAQEVDCDFEASTADNFIDGGLVRDAMSRFIDFEVVGTKVMGVDPARFGDDRSVISMRQGRVWHWSKIEVKRDLMHLVGVVSRLIEQHWPDAVFIDLVGIGAGVHDRLYEKFGARIRSFEGGRKATNYKEYHSMNDQAWGEMKKWFNGKVVAPNIDGLISEFSARKYKFNSDGQLMLEKKSDMKKRGIKSPDIADSVAMTFAEDVDYYDNISEYSEYAASDGRWY